MNNALKLNGDGPLKAGSVGWLEPTGEILCKPTYLKGAPPQPLLDSDPTEKSKIPHITTGFTPTGTRP